MTDKTCTGCDGSGWYAPTFSPDVLLNCLACNVTWSRGVGICAACNDDGSACPTCDGYGFVCEPRVPAEPGARGGVAP